MDLLLTGNGVPEDKARAVELYRTTALTAAQIAKSTNVSESGLRYHLRTWHRNLMLERRGGTVPDTADCIDLSSQKRYLKSTAEKYAPAIERLRAGGMPTAAAAAEFGLHPETFREYLYEHEPELAARLGMTRLADGRQVLARSMEKYGEAVRLYETTTEPLRSIADRLGAGRIASGLGPTKVTPTSAHFSAKTGSSATKPQPTHAASAPVSCRALPSSS